MMFEPLPMQPVVVVNGVARFVENRLVRHMLDHGGVSLNDLAKVRASRAEKQQLAQLIGYSVSGYLELNYVTNRSAMQATARAKRVMAEVRQ